MGRWIITCPGSRGTSGKGSGGEIMSDIEIRNQNENSHYEELFKKEWDISNDIQKFWFLIRSNEIEKLATRYDNLRSFNKNYEFKDNEFTKKDIIIYRTCLLIFTITFITSLFLVEDVRFLILSITCFYIIFKSMSFLRNLDEYDILKNKNMEKYHCIREMGEIEYFFRNRTDIDSIIMDIYSNYSNDESLYVFVKENERFRYHLLMDCKKNFR